MEAYFVGLLREAKESDEEIDRWLRERVRRDFKSIGKPPEWIQNPDWQMFEGKPMVFVGQIDVPRSAGLYAESSFYIFVDRFTGVTYTVIQVS